ncbi:hypothetical protein COT30_04455 [Candidatus Micrarchaeota archaeon CG08_land_8_20_14_0_20_49_17]|nr:MAG: hypothetical protein AUJ13_05675 [Candidatus Micrarchaeota archaeon CG1_02_49_24]PIU09418.1 MAG: hypothetical protein COT30_04455 [Candidatus Micrarchaeota archaeon CG08_land_8_20_14_0_20_49_17]PIZ98227.1 MAG: hypothetical protein COX84_02295 [Candidatus Micrarchaeota archaeon CG_4_10_14_0_2_um_filter_49_7]HII53870.1 hypothetical protein [Candidatus Micrarchaeota archaeon]
MKGMIISIDAITALSIVVLVFSTFYLTVAATNTHVAALKYAHLMAADTLTQIDTVTCAEAESASGNDISGICQSPWDQSSLLSEIARRNYPNNEGLILKTIDRMIPDQYGYSIEVYTPGPAPGTGSWASYFNSSGVSPSLHYGVNEYKLMASAEKVVAIDIEPWSAVNPYCYFSCTGDADNNKCAYPCTEDIVSTLNIGSHKVALVRLSVYI